MPRSPRQWPLIRVETEALTPRILQKVRGQYPRVQVSGGRNQQENGGPKSRSGDSVNTGFRFCREKCLDDSWRGRLHNRVGVTSDMVLDP